MTWDESLFWAGIQGLALRRNQVRYGVRSYEVEMMHGAASGTHGTTTTPTA